MTGNVKSRSAYERASPVRRGICGSPAAASGDRHVLLGRSVQRADQRAVLDLLDELHLVEQEHDPGALWPRPRRAAGTARRGRGRSSPRRPCAGRRRSSIPSGPVSVIVPQVLERRANVLDGSRAELQPRERLLRVPCDLPHQAAVWRQLVVEGQKPAGLGAILEGVQEHRLADPAQAADDHALLGGAALEAADEHPELLQLAGATRQLGGREPAFGVYGFRSGPSSTGL